MQPAAVLALGILVLTPESFVLRSDELYGAARAAIEKATTLSVAPYDLFSESVRVAAVRKCAGDSKCFLAQFVESGVAIDLLVTISVAQLDDRLLLGVRLIDAKTGAEINTEGGELSQNRRLDAELEPHLGRLFPPEIWGAIAAIELASDPAGALARASDRTCTTPCRLERVAPGPIEVAVHKDGFVDHRSQVVLQRGQTARVDAHLAPIPIAEEPSLFASPIFWISVAATVAIATTGAVVLATRGGDEPDNVCIANPGDCR